MPWRRPDSVPVGQVWSRFQGRPRDGQPGTMFQIRDMEDADRKQCLDMMQETFLRDEPLCQTLGVGSADPTSITTIRANWERFVDQQVSLACYTERDGRPERLAAFNIIVVRTDDEEEEDVESVKGESWKKLLRTLVTAEQLVDVFQLYGVRTYLSCSGLTVLPEFRGQNIGAQMLAARKPLCRALGITATCSVFTAIPSQVLAAKSGFQLLGELPYSAMKESGVDLDGCECPSAQLRGIKYDF